MIEAPIVSAVIIFFDAGALLEEAVRSVIAQTFDRWELLLVDDGSTDESREIARRFAAEHPERIRTLEHEGRQNRGKSASRNLGIRNASGRYVAFLDADDVWFPHALEEQVRCLEQNPSAVMVLGTTQRWQSFGDRGPSHAPDFRTAPAVTPNALYAPPRVLVACLRNEDAIPANSAVMIRAEILRAVGGFEEDFRDAYEDMVLYAKLWLTGDVYVAEECWSRYRQHAAMSCAGRAESGEWHPVRPSPARERYLRWLDGYRRSHGIADENLSRTLAVELEPYRHARGYRARRRVAYAVWRALSRHRLGTLARVRRRRGRLYAALARLGGGKPAELRTATAEPSATRFEGWHDVVDRTSIRGWACDPARPDARLAVDVWIDDEWLATVTADQYRMDLQAAGKGDGKHGFQLPLPPWLLDLRPHSVRVTYAGTEIGLRGTPKEICSESEAIERFAVHPLRTALRLASRHGPRALRRRLDPEWRYGEEWPPIGNVSLGTLRRLSPVSAMRGFDRGTPVDRALFEGFLARHCDSVRGDVLELGYDGWATRFGADRVHALQTLDLLAGSDGVPRAERLGEAIEVPSDTFDCILVPPLLQYVWDVRAAVRTLHRMLKPGGVLLVALPGIAPASDSHWGKRWYWSFTPASARRLLEEAFGQGRIEVVGYGNVLLSVASLHGLAAEEFHADELSFHEPGYEIVIAARAVKVEA